MPYFYTSSGADYQITTFYPDRPFCPITYECISAICNDADGVISFDGYKGELNFKTSNMTKYSPGLYKIGIRGTVGTTVKISRDVTLTIYLVNPCPVANIISIKELGFGDMVYKLGG